MNSETGTALPGEEFQVDVASLRGLFVTKSMGGSAIYPSDRASQQARQRMPGFNQSRAIRHHSRL